jgi:hypothetical protein
LPDRPLPSYGRRWVSYDRWLLLAWRVYT